MDTAILGLIRHDESQYRNSVETFVQYCEDNHLNLNVKKTKEIVFDFRIKKNSNPSDHALSIDDTDIEIVPSYKYLGTVIDSHWLPVRQRISFKILLIVYKALLGQTPTKFKHTHNLRSSLDTLLLYKSHHIKQKITLEIEQFACAAPKLWNNLPLEIRKSPSLIVFKSKLKAHLFI